MCEPVLVDALDEVAQHLLGHVEVGDHTILERADGANRSWGAAEHPLRLDAHSVHLAGAGVDRHHRGLREHDAATAHVDEGVRGTEVHGHVAAAEATEVAEKAHQFGEWRKGLVRAETRMQANPEEPTAEPAASSGRPSVRPAMVPGAGRRSGRAARRVYRTSQQPQLQDEGKNQISTWT